MIIGDSNLAKKEYFLSLLGGVNNNEPIINWLKEVQSVRDIFSVAKSFYDSLIYSQKQPAQMLREWNETKL